MEKKVSTVHNTKVVKKLIAAVGPLPEITNDIGIVYTLYHIVKLGRYIACCSTYLPLYIGELKLLKLRTFYT